MKTYDCIVVGGGHAGMEASLACAKLGLKTLQIVLNIKMMSNMPCNPSIGGSAKGIVVREIDALGGMMGIGADHNYLQMKMLNLSKGPGVHSLRAQVDKLTYPKYMQDIALSTANLEIIEGMVTSIIYSENRVNGVRVGEKEHYSKVVILTTGTHLESTILVGHTSTIGGPDGEESAHGLSSSLLEMGISLFRLKTGTPQRIDATSIDYSHLEPQYATDEEISFSNTTTSFVSFVKQLPCYLLYTNETTHQIIRDNLLSSAMYGGMVKGVGPRYCPSVEDKIVRFSDKPRHQLFLEPESAHNNSIYLQGLSTSMPEEVQDKMVHSLTGLENAKILKYAYAIEYDAIEPLQFDASLMVRKYQGLFGAGQIIGTSGYEEAAALGLIAGINAAKYIRGEKPLILGRDEAYIGVMIDDLVTKGTKEPYRLLSSRAEYRLLLRNDNAERRLLKYGHELGLINEERYNEFIAKEERIQNVIKELKENYLGINKILTAKLIELGFEQPNPSTSLYDILKRQNIKYEDIRSAFPKLGELKANVSYELEILVKYEGYIAQQRREANNFLLLEKIALPSEIDYKLVEGIRLEARDKLNKIKPLTIGMAKRIPGVTPADINVLMLHLKKGTLK